MVMGSQGQGHSLNRLKVRKSVIVRWRGVKMRQGGIKRQWGGCYGAKR